MSVYLRTYVPAGREWSERSSAVTCTGCAKHKPSCRARVSRLRVKPGGPFKCSALGLSGAPHQAPSYLLYKLLGSAALETKRGELYVPESRRLSNPHGSSLQWCRTRARALLPALTVAALLSPSIRCFLRCGANVRHHRASSLRILASERRSTPNPCGTDTKLVISFEPAVQRFPGALVEIHSTPLHGICTAMSDGQYDFCKECIPGPFD